MGKSQNVLHFFKSLIDTRGFSYVTRVQLAALSCCVVVVLAIMVAGFFTYKQERLPSLHEQHHERLKLLTFKTRTMLLEQEKNESGRVAVNASVSPTDLKLPRMPGAGELFIGEFEGTKALFGRDAKGGLWKKKFELPSRFWDRRDGLAYLLTSQSMSVGTSVPERIPPENLSNREAVKEYFLGGLARGMMKTRAERGETHFSAFMEVPQTNLVLFLEEDMTGFLAPLKKFYVLMAFFGVVVCAFVAVYIYYASKQLLAPVRVVHQAVGILLNPKQSHVKLNHPYLDEFGVILGDLERVFHGICERENRINHQRHCRGAYGEYLKNLDKAQDEKELLEMLLKFLKSHFSHVRVRMVSLCLFPVDDAGLIDRSQVWTVKLPAETSEMWEQTPVECMKASPSSSQAIISRNEVFLPLVVASDPTGFIQISSVENVASRVSRDDLTWLEYAALGLVHRLFVIRMAQLMNTDRSLAEIPAEAL